MMLFIYSIPETVLIVFNVSAIRHRFATQQVPSTEASTPLKVYNFLYFQGGGYLCWRHLLSGESMTNSAYVKNNGVDLLYKLVFCGVTTGGNRSTWRKPVAEMMKILTVFIATGCLPSTNSLSYQDGLIKMFRVAFICLVKLFHPGGKEIQVLHWTVSLVLVDI